MVLNPVAPRVAAGGLGAWLAAELERRGVRHKVLALAAGPRAREQLRIGVLAALRAGCPRVLVVGGDGAVSMVGDALQRRSARGRGSALAILPAGTANVLARELGIPMEPAAALELAITGTDSIEIDAIRASSGLVFTQVGIGPDAQMIRATTRAAQIRRGRWAYAATFLHALRGHPSHVFDLIVDGQPHRARAWQVVVANAGAAGTPPFTWGPGIDPTDGALELCVFAARSPREHLALAWRLLSGRHRGGQNARYFRVRERVTIRTEPHRLVQGDGEIIGRTPVTLSVVHRALRVVVARRVDDVPAVVGTPGDPASRPAMAAASVAGEAGSDHTVAGDVDVMVAQHSRAWILQGPWRHPFTEVAALDAAWFLRVNALSLGNRADRALLGLSSVMHYGEGWAVVAFAMSLADWRTGIKATTDALIVLWLTMLTVNFPLKRLFRRRRPFAEFVKARVLGPRPRDFSLPSGHSAAAFAGAYLFGAHAPGWSPLFYALAGLVGFSRVYLGVHYPSDVVIGALAGTALAIGFRFVLHHFLPGLG